MKFLCPQCKAKYQIPDEKISGRTLRMKCRRCEHDIVVKGDADSIDAAHHEEQARAPSARPAPGARKPSEPSLRTQKGRGGSGAGPLPKGSVPAKGSALGADFRKNVGHAPEPPRPQAASPLDAWHVAINDVPVGPMRREELARKISTGAVTGESLCWREGYDDWRPVKDTELSSLLARRSAVPTPARPIPGPPPGRPAPGRAPAPAGRPSPAAAGRPAPGRPAPAPAARPGAAAARSNVVPIGGRLGAAAAPALDEAPDDFEETEATTIAHSPFEEPARPSIPDAASLGALASTSSAGVAAAPAKAQSIPPPAAFTMPDTGGFPVAPAPMGADAPVVRRNNGLPVGAWMGIAFAGAAGVAIAVIFSLKFVLPQQQQVAQADTVAPPPTTVTVPEQPLDVTPPPATNDTEQPTTDTADTTDVAGVHRPTTPTKRGNAAPTGGGGAATKLSAADRAALAALQADGVGATPSVAQRPHPVDDNGPTGPEMSADQLRSVVTRGRPALQHCYELVARQSGSTETMRVDVHIVVGGSGVITRADASGNADALNTCIEREVRRWRFPGGGEATFPLVFQPQGG